MARINLTADRVREYECEPGKYQTILWDSAAPGLGVRATAKGAKAYIFQAKIKGTSTDARLTIGDPATHRLPAARLEANRLKSLADRGIDPREDKANAIATVKAERAALTMTATRESITLGDVWQTYVDDRKAKWSEGHLKNHINLAAAGGQTKKRGKGPTVAGPLSSLMSVRLADLTSDRIASWIDHEAETRPTNAGQSFRLLRAFIRWANDMPKYSGIIPSVSYSSRKVRDATPKNQTKPGDSIQKEQLQLWFEGVQKGPNPYRAAYLIALLLTGARRTELTELRWDNIDFEWNTMLIGDKNDGMRTIPLTPYLSHILAALPRKNDWVFYSAKSASGHAEEPKDAHAKALASVGLPHVSIHGLRRSFGTLAEWMDVPIGVVAQINGHKPSAIAEKHYRRRPIDILRMWHVKIEEFILNEAGITWTK